MQASLPHFPVLSEPYTVFVSDLHLSEKTPALNQLWDHLLASDFLRRADAFYILGDLFDFWLGDELLDIPAYAHIANQIAFLSSHHDVACYFQPGNRDFLVGKRFYCQAKLTPLEDPYSVDLYGIPVLLSHGDIFCTQDSAYQTFRKITRNKLIQWFFLKLPLNWRHRYYQKVVGQIGGKKTQKDSRILDIEKDTIAHYTASHSTSLTIHGHTHLPGIYREPFGQRAIIYDWRQTEEKLTAGMVIVTPTTIIAHPFHFPL